MNQVTLRGELEVVVVPGWGGKTVSVRHLATGEELLFQRPGVPEAKDRTNFGEWAFGWDDCWPSVEAAGPDYPDHGALWRQAGRIVSQTETSLTVELSPSDGQWSYTKTWQLEGSSVRLSIRIENRSRHWLPAFWTFHALVRVEDDMKLVFPGADERRTVFGENFAPGALPGTGHASKFWLPGPVENGFCGIDYPALGMAYRLEWDPVALPYLGYWVTNGGFQNQRNAAWEPSDGFYDSLAIARDNGALPVLGPGQTKEFALVLTWDSIR